MMIKKFLVLALVLGLASSASAVSVSLKSGGNSSLLLGVDVSINQVITVDLVSDTPAYGINTIDFLATADNPGDVKPVIAAAGSWTAWAATNTPGTVVAGDITGATGNGTSAIEGTGVLYSFTATVKGEGQLKPSMGASDFFTNISGPSPYYWAGTAITQNALVIVPEPVTIALLGLGGLFLRRRK